jgi:hypothetical protein
MEFILISSEKNYSHGWLGNTTDTLSCKAIMNGEPFIRGIAKPSVANIAGRVNSADLDSD